MSYSKHLQVVYSTKWSLLFQIYKPADLSGKNRVNPLVPLRTPWPWWSSGRICTQHHLSSPLKAGWAFLSLYLHHIAPMSQSPTRKHNNAYKYYQMIIIIITQNLKLWTDEWLSLFGYVNHEWAYSSNQMSDLTLEVLVNHTEWLTSKSLA